MARVFTDLYLTLTSFENLRLAYRKAARGKRGQPPRRFRPRPQFETGDLGPRQRTVDPVEPEQNAVVG